MNYSHAGAGNESKSAFDPTIHPPISDAAAHPLDDRIIISILAATAVYQAVLCLLNTQGIPVSRALLGLSEALILSACLPFITRRLLPGLITVILLCAAMFCLQSLVSGAVNIKTFRDLAIPLCYFWVGCNIGRVQLASRALIWTIWVVLFMGLLELFFLDQYTNFFDIFSYYVNTGNLDPVQTYNTTKLQLNGTRPEGIGRTLLPELLGAHRVSSVFLEPVSLGNFATICAAWGLSLDKSELRKTLFFVVMAIVMIVISDSRFALTTVSLMIAMRLSMYGKALYLPILAPFAAIALLVAIGEEGGKFMEDSFYGRLALSGNALHEFDIPMLFAMKVSSPYADMGYAHLISAFGLPVTLLLWCSLWLLPMPDEQGQRFRAFAAIYITLILCVSGYSLYALKTSGILWFLIGCCLKSPAPVRNRTELHSPTHSHSSKNSQSVHAGASHAELNLEPLVLDVGHQIRRRTDVN
ncbi:polysaccharide biosynthesis protein GumE [Cellvibrio sp.]|uniref:polysaccharide biosynthesis protein GumE n=1 Tax=Cellvibrio sp. TaxID=1965322 RepID=UPI0039647A0F